MLKQALILAGGLGTRFRSVRNDIPKPLAPIAGKPVLEHQLLGLAQAGVKRVVLCVGYLGDQIEQQLGSGEQLGVELVYSVETQPLGTAGAVANAKACLLPDPFCVLNGDTLMPEIDYQAMFSAHTHAGTPLSLAVTPAPDAGAYGILELDDTGQFITGFREKAPLGDDYRSAWISAGVYLFEHQIFKLIPQGQVCSMENEVFPRVLERQWPMAAFPYQGFFGDMGTPQGYARTDRFLSENCRQ